MDSGPSYMSFLSRYSNNGTSAASQGPTATRVLPKGNPAPSSTKAPTTARTTQNNTLTTSSTSTGSHPLSTNPVAPVRPNGAPSMSKPNSATVLKRKAEDELARPTRPGEVARNIASTKVSASSASTKSTIAGSKSTVKSSDSAKPIETQSTKAPKKGSYLDILHRAKMNAANQKAPVGAIVNKPRPPPEKKEKEWQKKFAEERAAKARGERTSKSPGLAASGEKLPTKTGVDKGGSGRKIGADTSSSKKSTAGVSERKLSLSTTSALSSKSSRPDPKHRPAAGSGRDREPIAPRRGRDIPEPQPRSGSAYDRERERDRGRPRIGGTRYVYREDSYDSESDSDMEAAGIDILEEEEQSSKVARMEDLEEEKLEKRLAAEKAARKRGLK